jgi:AraC family transcriptional regulator
MDTPGVRKYPASTGLLASSAGLGWSALAVELRSHGVCETQAIIPQHVEICLVVAGNNDGVVRRTIAGTCQEDTPTTGAIWLSPVGVAKSVAITASVPQTAHVYLPTTLFDRLKDEFNLPGEPAESIRHAAGIRDDVIDQIGRSVLCALDVQTTSSRMYAELAAATLAARICQEHCEGGSSACLPSDARPLDQVRLRHVLDYMSAHIEEDITLTELANAGGQSRFHFARKFALAMGVSPMRYLSQMRLEKAMAELAAGKAPLAEIALNAGFSSQASFTRAFSRATGTTPNAYRRLRR